ncbi:MAG: VWA domain-containing protein [Pirellulaceae bacterium]|nr:VWA domain-containing protein [Pirellulaceae bacterium]
MNVRNRFVSLAALVAVVSFWVTRADGQRITHTHRLDIRAISSNVILPQSRSFTAEGKSAIDVTDVKVGVVILEQAATTTMDISLKNTSGSRQEAELLVPVPEGAAIRGFDFQGSGKEPSAELLPKDKAVATYESIVAKIKDPALLEFAGLNLIRSSVFPIDANGTQKIRLTYEHLLTADGPRVDYALPRTESIDYKVPWEVSVKIKSRRPISTVYSPSHEVRVEKTRGGREASVKIGREAMSEPGPLQLSYLMDLDGGVTASLIAYPDVRIDGGYFLLLAGLPADASVTDANGAPTVKREVTLVIDRSGSMAGEKLEQAKEAALQVIDGLYDGEAFNVIDYSDSIASFAPAPVVKNNKNAKEARHYVRRLTAAGGTNIHDTLMEALRPKPTKATLPIVLFLTDGLPTIGVRSEVAIREAVEKANKHKRRIFTFGVGYDVNAPLLNFLARNSRAISTYVLPGEEIESKVSQVYRRLFGPVLSTPELQVLDAKGEVTTRRVAELMPSQLPDLFEGDQLVLLGQYKSDVPLRFQLAGDFRGKARTFQFNFKLNKATTKNSFVPRLWASRKIGMLIDEIRQAGADSGDDPSVIAANAKTDPRLKELVDEIVRLSVEFGILTEYTAFLAREGTDLDGRDSILLEANNNLIQRAQNVRHGVAAVNQAFNDNFQQGQFRENRRNHFFDQNMNRVQITRVQQINDRAFFQRGNRWVDGQAINSATGTQPDRTVVFGTPEFSQLLQQLVAENRQGALAMSGEVLLRVGDRNVLVKGE